MITKIEPYYKALVGAVLAALAAYSAAALNGHVTQSGWIAVAVAFITALAGVGVVTNAPTAKAKAAQQALDDRLALHERTMNSQTAWINDIDGRVPAKPKPSPYADPVPPPVTHGYGASSLVTPSS